MNCPTFLKGVLAASITAALMGVAQAETDVFGVDIENPDLRRAAAQATTEAELIAKHAGLTQATIDSFKNAVKASVKAGNCISLSGYGDLGTGGTPACFYAKVTTATCTLDFTANSLNCAFDPTKTKYEWGNRPNYYNATKTKWASDLSAAMGSEYANFASKLVPAVQAEWVANPSGVAFSGLGTFTFKVSATTGATSIGFTGETVVFP